MFGESIHFMITIVTIYRIVLERSSIQWNLCDWDSIVGISFLLTISHGLIVILSFLLWLGIELSSNSEDCEINQSANKWNLLLWHHWMMFEWSSDLPFHYSYVGILLWWMLPFNSALLNTVVLEFINVRIGSGCESMDRIIQNC